eukprot:scaffold13.g191.t1
MLVATRWCQLVLSAVLTVDAATVGHKVHQVQDTGQRASFRRRAAGSDESAAAGGGSSSAAQQPPSTFEFDSTSLPENFCIIESQDSVKDFADLQLEEVQKNIQSRRNRIFLLMEEVRRLRIQLRLRGGSEAAEVAPADEAYPSSIPFFPPLTDKTIQLYLNVYALLVACIIAFGGIVAPMLEVRMGLGGSSYYEFITSMHLPTQLAEVDPIVASFCGGGVGVLTSLLIVEANNAKRQAKQRCMYCEGTGYLACGACVGCGVSASGSVCAVCAGTGKVMCTSCLATGKQLASEHDRRIDPFQLE